MWHDDSVVVNKLQSWEYIMMSFCLRVETISVIPWQAESLDLVLIYASCL